MPCRVELSESEIRANRQAQTNAEIAKVVKPVQDRNDTLTHENDLLREALIIVQGHVGREQLEMWVGGELLSQVNQNQVEHRKEDLRRLNKTFLDKMVEAATDKKISDSDVRVLNALEWSALLLKVREADPTKPLEEQLGFNPDKY